MQESKNPKCISQVDITNLREIARMWSKKERKVALD
jgi:hypothetical protein